MQQPRHRGSARVHACPLCWIAASASAARGEPAPLLLQQAGKVVIPADSRLRKQIAVAAVGSRTGPHAVSAPATVEANPSRVVTVLPPLKGRLVELKVGLGDAVRCGPILALISSPDLAQAQTDVMKRADAHSCYRARRRSPPCSAGTIRAGP